MAEPRPGTLLTEERSTEKATGDRGTSRRDIVIDSGLGPMTVVAVVRKKPPHPIYQQLAHWVPNWARDQVKELELAGEFQPQNLRNRKDQRFLRRMVRASAKEIIVFWVGFGPHNVEVQIYREFPWDMNFYLDYARGDHTTAHLLYAAHTTFNRDLWHFVDEHKMSPEQAKRELRRINQELGDLIIQAMMVFQAGLGAVAAIRSFGPKIGNVAEAGGYVSRRAPSIAERRQLPQVILYRGTTLRRVRGEIRTGVDDFGPGTYFADSEKVARLFAHWRKSPGDPGIVLRATVDEKLLGRVLDLTQPPHRGPWKQLAAPLLQSLGGKLANENYLNLLEAYLQGMGKTLDNFDVVIGPNYLHGGIQVNIRKSKILDQILELADEIARMP